MGAGRHEVTYADITRSLIPTLPCVCMHTCTCVYNTKCVTVCALLKMHGKRPVNDLKTTQYFCFIIMYILVCVCRFTLLPPEDRCFTTFKSDSLTVPLPDNSYQIYYTPDNENTCKADCTCTCTCTAYTYTAHAHAKKR